MYLALISNSSYAIDCSCLVFLVDCSHSGKYLTSIIGAVTWFIWKTRCDYIFRGKIHNCNLIDKLSMNQVKVFKVIPDILYAGLSPIMEDTNITVDGSTILIALERVEELNLNCKHIYINNSDLWRFLHGLEEVNNWRAANSLANIKHQMRRFNEPPIHLIPAQWNKIAATMASKGVNAFQLSLFHKGMDLPRWLMRLLEHSFFNF